ncbi:hypothetical protein J2X69_000418 [Algoriphagus sp. 4150]|uniref:hypothetical protein n=1 Tax=Algoriphagus sp. 4150 TaxID=2817756 RepID=UPI002863B0DE|nr:hypothetical protein [Algoriphagus sp. 4150]MDR7128090.1 hypothetical protein [Algoriphagus sp. 4150]
MNKKTYLKEIRKRLPDDITLEDETENEISDDEFIGVLSWIKYFNSHYKEHGKDNSPVIIFPIISRRLRLDFGLYRFPSDSEINRGKHVIYISNNEKSMDGTIKKRISVKEIINVWKI